MTTKIRWTENVHYVDIHEACIELPEGYDVEQDPESLVIDLIAEYQSDETLINSDNDFDDYCLESWEVIED